MQIRAHTTFQGLRRLTVGCHVSAVEKESIYAYEDQIWACRSSRRYCPAYTHILSSSIYILLNYTSFNAFISKETSSHCFKATSVFITLYPCGKVGGDPFHFSLKWIWIFQNIDDVIYFLNSLLTHFFCFGRYFITLYYYIRHILRLYSGYEHPSESEKGNFQEMTLGRLNEISLNEGNSQGAESFYID